MTAAADVYRRDGVLALPKEQLLLRLYDALLLRLDEGQAAIAAGERPRAGRAISKAFDIVTALRDALDPASDADCVAQLDRLYRTVGAWLLEANLTQSAALLASSRRILGTLKDGWHGAVAAAR